MRVARHRQSVGAAQFLHDGAFALVHRLHAVAHCGLDLTNVLDQTLETARLYRRALWRNAGAYCEVWLEKDALAGVIYPVTAEYDVPLMVARGYSSLSFLYSAAEYIGSLEVPAFIYHLGDFDPSGVNAGEKIEETLREMAPEADITFERLAVTTVQRVIPWGVHWEFMGSSRVRQGFWEN